MVRAGTSTSPFFRHQEQATALAHQSVEVLKGVGSAGDGLGLPPQVQHCRAVFVAAISDSVRLIRRGRSWSFTNGGGLAPSGLPRWTPPLDEALALAPGSSP